VPGIEPDTDHPGLPCAFYVKGEIGTVGRTGEPATVFRAGLTQLLVAVPVFESGQAYDALIPLV